MRTARNKLHIRALMQFNRARSPACLPLQLLKKKGSMKTIHHRQQSWRGAAGRGDVLTRLQIQELHLPYHCVFASA